LTIIAKCIIDGGKIAKAGFLPCLINSEGQPELLKHDDRGQRVFDYMQQITAAAALNARYEWEGDEVVVH
jgi:poly-gamma-glutamate synthesis protein (capsule biosynthesis protein)